MPACALTGDVNFIQNLYPGGRNLAPRAVPASLLPACGICVHSGAALHRACPCITSMLFFSPDGSVSVVKLEGRVQLTLIVPRAHIAWYGLWSTDPSCNKTGKSMCPFLGASCVGCAMCCLKHHVGFGSREVFCSTVGNHWRLKDSEVITTLLYMESGAPSYCGSHQSCWAGKHQHQ